MFKSIARLYERRYHKDIKDCIDVLGPIVEIIDSVFEELSKKRSMMNKPVQDSFTLAYAECKYLEPLQRLDGAEIESALTNFSSFGEDNQHTIDALLSTVNEIRKKGWYNKNNNLDSEPLYVVAAAKRKLERKLDWIFSSLNRQSISKINEKLEVPHSVSQIKNEYSSLQYDEGILSIRSLLAKKFKKYSDDELWKNSQYLSLILKSNSEKNDFPLIDSKMIPDANSLNKVRTITQYMGENRISVTKLASKMQLSTRMTQYYLDAAQMLGIVEKKGKYYFPSKLSLKIHRYSDDDKSGILQETLLELPIVKAFLLYMKNISRSKFIKKDIAKFLETHSNLSYSTAFRRSSTIAAWLCESGIATRNDNGFLLIHEDIGQTKILEFIR